MSTAKPSWIRASESYFRNGYIKMAGRVWVMVAIAAAYLLNLVALSNAMPESEGNALASDMIITLPLGIDWSYQAAVLLVISVWAVMPGVWQFIDDYYVWIEQRGAA